MSEFKVSFDDYSHSSKPSDYNTVARISKKLRRIFILSIRIISSHLPNQSEKKDVLFVQLHLLMAKEVKITLTNYNY